MDKKNSNHGKRGIGKKGSVIHTQLPNCNFRIPRAVCRDLGLMNGGTLEYQRNILSNGEIEYTLRSVTKCDVFTKETDGTLIEYQGVTVSEKSIIELAKIIGILPQEHTD